MTKLETINLLEGDPLFAANFIVNNNFTDLVTKMNEKGLYPRSKDEAVLMLLELGKNNDTLTLNYVLSIPFRTSTPPEDVSSLRDYFIRRSPAPMTSGTPTREGDFDWTGLLVGLGATLSGIGSIIHQTPTGGATSTDIAAQTLALQTAQAQADAKRKKTWTTIGIVAAIIVAILVIAYFVRKGKK